MDCRYMVLYAQRKALRSMQFHFNILLSSEIRNYRCYSVDSGQSPDK